MTHFLCRFADPSQIKRVIGSVEILIFDLNRPNLENDHGSDLARNGIHVSSRHDRELATSDTLNLRLSGCRHGCLIIGAPESHPGSEREIPSKFLNGCCRRRGDRDVPQVRPRCLLP